MENAPDHCRYNFGLYRRYDWFYIHDAAKRLR